MLNNISPTIAVLDSGIGGVAILNKLIEKYQYGNFIYFADNLNMPYGNKSKKSIKDRVNEIIYILQTQYKVDLIVVACNTASSVLRNENLNNVVKLKFDDKEATYLTTVLTEKNLKGIKTISSCTLAKVIEDNIDNTRVLEIIVKKEIKKHKLNKLDKLILGCTHYELVIDLFRKYCPKTIVIGNSDYILDDIDYKPINSVIATYIITTKQDKRYIDKIKRLIRY